MDFFGGIIKFFKGIGIAFIVLIVILIINEFRSCKTSDKSGDEPVFYISYFTRENKITLKYGKNGFNNFEAPSEFGYEFVGFYDKEDGGTQIFDKNGNACVEINKDLFVSPHFNPIELSINFYDTEENLVDSSKVLYDSKINSFPYLESSNELYEFVGWCDESGTIYSDQSKVLENKKVFNNKNYNFSNDCVNLYAKYDLKKYTVTLDYNTLDYRNETFEFEVNSKFNFANLKYEDTGSMCIDKWSLNPNYYVEWDGIITEDITLYAMWKNYRIFTLYVDEQEYDSIKLYQGESYELPELTKHGYLFNGWYTSKLYSGQPVSYINWSDSNYYLKFDLEIYKIQFVSNSDTVLSDKTYTILDSFDLPIPEKINYNFVGWSDKEDLTGTLIKKIKEGTYGNKVLYAKYRGCEKELVLNPNGGSLNTLKKKVIFEENYSLDIPTYKGYSFVGWYTQKGGNEIQLTDSLGKCLNKWTITDDVTNVYAKYVKQYYVIIEENIVNASSNNLNEYYYNGDEVNLELKIINGYKFIGLYLDGELVTKELTYDLVIDNEDIVLEAKFEPIPITFTLNAAGGYCSISSVDLYFDDKVTLPTAFKQGHKFLGWGIAVSLIQQDEKKYYTVIDNEYILLTSENGELLNNNKLYNNYELTAYFEEDPTDTTMLVYDSTTLLSIKDNPNGIYQMICDIDMSGVDWTPFSFSGTINGNGFTIYNLSMTSSNSNLGLFDTLSGTVKNLKLENVNITSNAYSAVLIGTICSKLTGTIENVTVTSGEIIGFNGYIGGLVGKQENGQINNCINYSNIKGDNIEDQGACGGIVALFTKGQVIECLNYGNVDNKYQCGGIIGYASCVSIEGGENYGEVKGKKDVGGLIGLINVGGTYSIVSRLTNNGKVIGEDNTGGVIGRVYNSTNSYSNYTITFNNFYNASEINGLYETGGIIGSIYAWNSNYSCTLMMNNHINIGNISGDNNIGGIVGWVKTDNGNSIISNCKSSSEIVGKAYVGGIAGYIEAVVIDTCDNSNSSITATEYTISGSEYHAYLGGYVGLGYAVKNCENNVEIIYEERGSFVGGIAGCLSGYLENCNNKANITALKANYVGGIVGYTNAAGNISYISLNNSGNITANNYTGGVVGYLYNSTNSYSNYTITLSRFNNKGNITGINRVGGVIGSLYANNSNETTKVIGTILQNSGTVTGEFYVGGVIGYGSSDTTSSEINECSNSSEIIGKAYIGGIVGYMADICIDSCQNEGTTIIASGYLIKENTYYAAVGGYAGECYSISNCHNSSEIIYDEVGICVGGIVGICSGYEISNCTNDAKVSAPNSDYVGGIVGYVTRNGAGSYTSLENSGNITGKNYTGGIIGCIYNSTNSYSNYTITLSRFNNKGNITGINRVGGVIGSLYANNSNQTTKVVATEFISNGDVKGTITIGGFIGYFYSDGASSLTGYTLTGKVIIDGVENNSILVSSNTNLTIKE